MVALEQSKFYCADAALSASVFFVPSNLCVAEIDVELVIAAEGQKFSAILKGGGSSSLAGCTCWLDWLAALAGCAGWLRWLAALAGCTGWLAELRRDF